MEQRCKWKNSRVQTNAPEPLKTFSQTKQETSHIYNICLKFSTSTVSHDLLERFFWVHLNLWDYHDLQAIYPPHQPTPTWWGNHGGVAMVPPAIGAGKTLVWHNVQPQVPKTWTPFPILRRFIFSGNQSFKVLNELKSLQMWKMKQTCI